MLTRFVAARLGRTTYYHSTSNLAPSLKSFRIEFDRPGATYAPGETITGNVIIELAREKIIRVLTLSIKGEANVKWDRGKATKDSQGRYQTVTEQQFRGNEQYFNKTYSLLGDLEDEEIPMAPGFRKYSFNFVLPHNIPCSFEHTNGHIRYTAKAVINRLWRFDHECKVAFTVVTPYDLNVYRRQCVGIDDEDNENYYCFCFNLGSIKTNIKLPTTGFVPGQSIKTTVGLENTSRVTVTRICLKLERSLEFHAKLPYHMSKKDKVIVKEGQSTGPFDQLSNIVLRLQVPPIPPSQLKHCGIIDQKYTVRITVHVSSMHCSITRTYPILIGTIPLRSIPSAPYQQNLLRPTAPMLYDNDPSPPMPTSPDHAPSNMHYAESRSISFVSDDQDQPSTSTNEWDMPPPSYEECMQRADSIKDNDDSIYVHGANEPFAPRYPVFNFPTPPYSPGK